MTTEQQDKAWQSLPEDFKKKIIEIYDSLICYAKEYIKQNNGHEEEYCAAKIETYDALFGKHNLTANDGKTKEVNKVRKINVGDVVRIKRETPSNLYNNMPYAFVDMPFFVTEIEVDCDNGLNDVARLRNGSTYLNIHPHWLQKEDIHHKWENKDGRQDAVDKAIATWRNSPPDWLSYRMELAKEVVTALIRKGHNIAFVAESTSLIVDGIVKRLKGGEK